MEKSTLGEKGGGVAGVIFHFSFFLAPNGLKINFRHCGQFVEEKLDAFIFCFHFKFKKFNNVLVSGVTCHTCIKVEDRSSILDFNFRYVLTIKDKSMHLVDDSPSAHLSSTQ